MSESIDTKAIVGQLLVLADLLKSAIKVVGTVVGDTIEEDEALEDLIAKSEAAIAAVLIEHAMGKGTGDASHG
jgi:hypothetical protein